MVYSRHHSELCKVMIIPHGHITLYFYWPYNTWLNLLLYSCYWLTDCKRNNSRIRINFKKHFRDFIWANQIQTVIVKYKVFGALTLENMCIFLAKIKMVVQLCKMRNQMTRSCVIQTLLVGISKCFAKQFEYFARHRVWIGFSSWIIIK